MLPLKKIFPVIIALITLSLLGIIYIQYNWIISVTQIKKEEKEQRTTEAVGAVGELMVQRQKTMADALKVDIYKQGEGTSTLFLPDGRKRRISVGERFEPREVNEMLIKAMKDKKLDTVFEFGVLKGSNILFSSPRFNHRLMMSAEDSLNFKLIITPLVESIGIANGVLFDPSMEQETLFVFVPQSSFTVFKSLGWMIFGGIVFTIIIVTAFALTIRTMLGQKKLSEIKSDFINNMTHELKTPLATISLAIDAIGNERVMDNKDKIRYFSGIIKEENKRMNKQVESILQSALMEKEELALNLQPIDVHQLITNTVENLQLQLDGKNGRVELQLNAHQPVIKADEVHFSNLIFNLLDNAIKYSKDNLEVRIATSNTRKNLVISIADNGIGMSRDTVSRIFEKFYRAHTGNVHNVKGFGLGLTYVKAIVDAHKGKIRVESILGKGSRFTMEFPQD